MYFLSSKNIVVQGEQLYFITNFTYKCAFLILSNGLSPVVIETFCSCVSPDGRNWLSARLPLIFTMASKCTFLLLFLFHFFLTCILDSQFLFYFFFFVCTEILGLLPYGNTWKETSDIEQKSRFSLSYMHL